MQLSIKALGITSALLWGGAILVAAPQTCQTPPNGLEGVTFAQLLDRLARSTG